jgi:hypothetical protein
VLGGDDDAVEMLVSRCCFGPAKGVAEGQRSGWLGPARVVMLAVWLWKRNECREAGT